MKCVLLKVSVGSESGTWSCVLLTLGWKQYTWWSQELNLGSVYTCTGFRIVYGRQTIPLLIELCFQDPSY